MDVIQIFNDELQSLLDTKPPVSKAKMGLITRAAMKGVKFYKHIVQSVEKFIAKCRPEYKVPGLYVIDSIVRQSRHQFGPDRDVYAARFSRNLQITFNNLFAGCSVDDKPKIVRVLNLWQKNGVFNSQVIQPLLDMANPNSSLNLPSESSLSADSPNLESKQGQTSKFLMHHYNSTNNGNNNNSGNNQQQLHAKNSTSASKHHRSSEGGGLRFSKNMLDFDYDEDDDDDGDETPTEAEPPLSSTLNKIEMEQRNRNDIPNSSPQSSQMHQQSNINSNSRNDQDPVLERWNRLMRQQSITNENSNDQIYNETRANKHKSRSSPPPPLAPFLRDEPAKYVPPPKEESPPKVKRVRGNSTEREAEREAERLRKCLPPIRDKHITVCSSTLWLGHVPKTVSEADISDAFGEYGAITSIDLIPPRGCAYVCMDRRQDAKKALSKSKDLKLNGSHIKMAWAPGKGFKEYKKLKDFWEVDIGCSYIPYKKIDPSIDFDILEEGGVIDEDSMSMEMREMRERKAKEKESKSKAVQPSLSLPLPALPILAQPPPFTIPPPNLSIPPPTSLSQAPGLGGIPFPPPIVTSTSSQMPTQQNLYDHQDSQQEHSLNDGGGIGNLIAGGAGNGGGGGLNSPNSIDQQLSMTERQISMVEQQLSMMQQAHGLNHPQPGIPQMPHPQSIYHQAQPNPMIFDMPPPQMLHGAPQMMDPNQQIPIFANQPLLGQPPPMLPISQASMNPGMGGNSMPHYGGRY